MKTRTLILAATLTLSGATFAQKLSPNTELMLLNRNSGLGMKSVAFGDNETVGAFVKLSDRAAIAQIEALGGTLSSELTETVVTMRLPVAQLRAIAGIDGVEYIQMGNDVKLNMDKARADINADSCHELEATTGHYTGSGVVVGVIDSGIELGHPAYWTSDGQSLRIKRFWNQNSRVGLHPKGFGYGREFTSQEAILAVSRDTRDSYHGGHVTGCATGADKSSGFYGVAPDADIVFVSTDMSTTGVVDGVKYIFNYADSVGKPAVINMSLGTHSGPHNGMSVEDQSYESLAGPGRIIVGAAGNEGDLKLHVSKTMATEGADSMAVIVKPYNNYYYSTGVDIWGEAGTQLKGRIVIVNSSTGNILATTDTFSTASPATQSKSLSYTTRNFSVQYSTTVDAANNQPNIAIVMSGSASSTVRLGFIIEGEAGTTIHAWSPTQDEFVVPSAGVQKKGWTPGDANYTVGETGGTGKAVISVGSYNTQLRVTTIENYVISTSTDIVGDVNGISTFSSRGPTADGRQKPDITAPGCLINAPFSQYYSTSDDAFSTSSATAKTTFNGSNYYYTAQAGTSMAAPIAAGTIALWLQAEPTLTYEKIREVLKQTSRRDSYTGEATTENDNTWGAGKIDAFAGLKYVIEHHNDLSGIDDTQSADNEVFKLVTHRDARTAEVFFPANGKTATVSVYNVQGQQVATFTVSDSGQTLDLNGIGDGVYLFKLQHGGSTQTVKTAL